MKADPVPPRRQAGPITSRLGASSSPRNGAGSRLVEQHCAVNSTMRRRTRCTLAFALLLSIPCFVGVQNRCSTIGSATADANDLALLNAGNAIQHILVSAVLLWVRKRPTHDSDCEMVTSADKQHSTQWCEAQNPSWCQVDHCAHIMPKACYDKERTHKQMHTGVMKASLGDSQSRWTLCEIAKS